MEASTPEGCFHGAAPKIPVLWKVLEVEDPNALWEGSRSRGPKCVWLGLLRSWRPKQTRDWFRAEGGSTLKSKGPRDARWGRSPVPITYNYFWKPFLRRFMRTKYLLCSSSWRQSSSSLLPLWKTPEKEHHHACQRGLYRASTHTTTSLRQEDLTLGDQGANGLQDTQV